MQDLKYINIAKALFLARQKFKKAKIKNPDREAEILLQQVLKKDKAFLYANFHKNLTLSQLNKYKQLIERRTLGQPLAYLLGFKEFYGLKFLVNKHVLIPRPETELIVEKVLNFIQNSKLRIKNFVLIDVGTGSGCLPIAIFKKINDRLKIKNYKVYGLDISPGALAVAKKNAQLNKVDKKIKFIRSDLLTYFLNPKTSKILSGQIILTANLPYLSANIYQENYHNLKFEPPLALVAGRDGLKYYREMLGQIKKIAKAASLSIYLEINPQQKNKIKKIILNYLPKAKIEFEKDLTGRNRLVIVNLN